MPPSLGGRPVQHNTDRNMATAATARSAEERAANEAADSFIMAIATNKEELDAMVAIKVDCFKNEETTDKRLLCIANGIKQKGICR